MAGDEPIVIGVDIGGTKIHAASFTPDIRVLDEVRASTAHGRQALLDQVVETVGRLADLTSRPVAGIGIGCPGVIDRKQGTIQAAVNLGISGEPLDLVTPVAKAHGVFCTMDNDVNVGALGVRQLLDPLSPDLAYLSIGTGLAAGIILDGRSRRGRTGVAGEIGHFPVEPSGPRCECGLKGCLEALASGNAISRNWPAKGGVSSAAGLLAAAEAGDHGAMAVRQRLGHHLAMAAYLITVAYDIDPIVIGGGVAEVGPELMALIKHELEYIGDQSAFAKGLRIGDRLALRPDGPVGPVGAAVMAIDELGWSPS